MASSRKKYILLIFLAGLLFCGFAFTFATHYFFNRWEDAEKRELTEKNARRRLRCSRDHAQRSGDARDTHRPSTETLPGGAPSRLPVSTGQRETFSATAVRRASREVLPDNPRGYKLTTATFGLLPKDTRSTDTKQAYLEMSAVRQNGREPQAMDPALDEIYQERKREAIRKYYSARTAQAEVVEVAAKQNWPAQDPERLTAASPRLSPEQKSEQVLMESLSELSLLDPNGADTLKTYREMLKPDNPEGVRVQALYLLHEVAPGEVVNYLNDPNDMIRFECLRLLGHYPSF